MKDNLRAEIRRAITKQETPFSTTDLYVELGSLTEDRNLILQCLEELYERGLVVYKNVGENDWAFVIIS